MSADASAVPPPAEHRLRMSASLPTPPGFARPTVLHSDVLIIVIYFMLRMWMILDPSNSIQDQEEARRR
jgi:hypothetical protein